MGSFSQSWGCDSLVGFTGDTDKVEVLGEAYFALKSEAWAYKAGLPAGYKGLTLRYGDKLVYPRGSQIAGLVYANFSPYQGTIRLSLDPDFDGGDDNLHVVWETNAGTTYFRLYIKPNGDLTWEIKGAGKPLRVANISTPGITLGTKYHIVATWDVNHVLPDGSYYLKLYLDYSTTATQSQKPGFPDALEAYLRVGDAKIYPSGSLLGTITGLMIESSPWTDAQVQADYNSGSGVKAYVDKTTKLMPLFDEEINTALTWPYADNLVANGLIEAAALGTAFVVYGSGTVALNAVKGNVKHDTQSLRVQGTNANDGSRTGDITVTAEEYYHLALWFKVITGTMTVEVYDQSGTATIITITGLTASSFTKLPIDFLTPAGCTAVRILIYQEGAPALDVYVDDVQAYENLISNGGMEGTYASGVAPGWTEVGSVSAVESADEYANDKAQGIGAGDSSSNHLKQDITVVSGNYYTLALYAKRLTGANNININLSGAHSETLVASSGSYGRMIVTFKAVSNSLTLKLYCGATTTGVIDHAFLYELDTVSPAAYPDSRTRVYSDFPIIITPAFTSLEVKRWLTFAHTLGPNHHTLARVDYQLSTDGINAKYWDGSAWAAVGSNADNNDIATVLANLSRFPISDSAIYVHIVFESDGSQECELDHLSISWSALFGLYRPNYIGATAYIRILPELPLDRHYNTGVIDAMTPSGLIHSTKLAPDRDVFGFSLPHLLETELDELMNFIKIDLVGGLEECALIDERSDEYVGKLIGPKIPQPKVKSLRYFVKLRFKGIKQ